MKEKSNDFDKMSIIFSQFTEKNKKGFVKTAKTLLSVQRADAEMVANTPIPSMEAEKRA